MAENWCIPKLTESYDFFLKSCGISEDEKVILKYNLFYTKVIGI